MLATKSRPRTAKNTVADVLAALRVAAVRLDQAIKEFTPWPLCRMNYKTGVWETVPGKFSDSFTLDDLQRCRRNVHKLGLLLTRRADRGSPTISGHVLARIKRLVNEHRNTTPHLESVCLAVKLAEHCADGVDVAVHLALKMIGYELAQGLSFVPRLTLKDLVLPRQPR